MQRWPGIYQLLLAKSAAAAAATWESSERVLMALINHRSTSDEARQLALAAAAVAGSRARLGLTD